MAGKIFFTVFGFFLFLTTPVLAATCLDGGCHSPLLATKYVHGPVAAEALGVKGCVMCHEPEGEGCKGNGGSFKPFKPAGSMCQTCHAMGHGSQHTSENIDCLKCHDPHGSETNSQFSR